MTAEDTCVDPRDVDWLHPDDYRPLPPGHPLPKRFRALYGFCSTVEDIVERDDCALGFCPKVQAKLCQMLGDQCYSYLVLHDGLCHEIVRVEQAHGLIYAERGIDDSDKQRWPCGTRVKFDWVPSAVWDQKKEMPPEQGPAGCPPERFTGKVRNGICTIHFKDGIATHQTINKDAPRDGCYENPVLTFEDGCIVYAAEGGNLPSYGYPLPFPGCCDHEDH